MNNNDLFNPSDSTTGTSNVIQPNPSPSIGTQSNPIEVDTERPLNVIQPSPYLSIGTQSNPMEVDTGERPSIDLKLVKIKGTNYAIDTTQKSGVNLIELLQPQGGKEKPELVRVNCHLGNYKGYALDIDGSTKMTSIFFQGKRYDGHYVDLNYPNTTVTSFNVPIQKNDSGAIFIINKRPTGFFGKG